MERSPEAFDYGSVEKTPLQPSGPSSKKKNRSRCLAIACVILSICLVGFFSAYTYVRVRLNEIHREDFIGSLSGPPPSPSSLEQYRFAAVASDSDFCATIGSYLMTVKGGSAVDAAIGTQLCSGVFNMHSCGIGGGSFMLIHEKSSGNTYGIDFREKAPAAATKDMFANKPKASTIGGLAIAVPGEIAGYYAAWRRFGKLAWNDLFQPTIDLCRSGYKITKPVVEAMMKERKYIDAFDGLRGLLVNPDTNLTYELGDTIRNPLLASTLQTIADDPNAFYNGSLASTIVSEITGAGGIVSLQDLRSYRAAWRKPVSMPLENTRLVIHGMPPPSSGAILGFMLAVLDGYKITSAIKKDLEQYALFYHRLVETFKFGYAKRSALGDIDFAKADMTEVLRNLTSLKYADQIRSEINDAKTMSVSYYHPSFDWKEDHGTSHLSVVSPDGDAVAITSTINTRFGSKVRGPNTGIIYNNEMDDFSTPNTTNYFGIPSSPTNYIEPGKRPMSSMSPTIITAKNGSIVLVVGASGGSKITTAVAHVSSRVLFLGDTIKEAIDFPRVHHQLLPDVLKLEKGFPQAIIDILRKKGHDIGSLSLSVTQGIHGQNGTLFANCDYRKEGKSSGQ